MLTATRGLDTTHQSSSYINSVLHLNARSADRFGERVVYCTEPICLLVTKLSAKIIFWDELFRCLGAIGHGLANSKNK
jgi:hypothetical protein